MTNILTSAVMLNTVSMPEIMFLLQSTVVIRQNLFYEQLCRPIALATDDISNWQ